jgi:hypothetical protein
MQNVQYKMIVYYRFFRAIILRERKTYLLINYLPSFEPLIKRLLFKMTGMINIQASD